MLEFQPTSLFVLPRWLETIVQAVCFQLALIILQEAVAELFDYSLYDYTIVTISYYLIIFLILKLQVTFTAVDGIEIDFERKLIHFEYWLFYFYKTNKSIQFDEITYKTNLQRQLFGGLSLYIYQNKKMKIKINNSNGWQEEHVTDLINKLMLIKPPLNDSYNTY